MSPAKKPLILFAYIRKKQPANNSIALVIDPKVGNGKGNQIIRHNNNIVNDLDLPIALRKGIRTCILHPISQFPLIETLTIV